MPVARSLDAKISSKVRRATAFLVTPRTTIRLNGPPWYDGSDQLSTMVVLAQPTNSIAVASDASRPISLVMNDIIREPGDVRR